MSSQYISLSAYSNKYNVSISTLRRRIRCGQVDTQFHSGKYFLKDESLESLLKTKRASAVTKKNKTDLKNISSTAKNFISTKEEALESKAKTFSSMSSFTQLKEKDNFFSFIQQFMEIQKKLYQKLEVKELQIQKLQDKVMDSNTLIALLEKENKELKSVLYKTEKMEDWLEK